MAWKGGAVAVVIAGTVFPSGRAEKAGADPTRNGSPGGAMQRVPVHMLALPPPDLDSEADMDSDELIRSIVAFIDDDGDDDHDDDDDDDDEIVAVHLSAEEFYRHVGLRRDFRAARETCAVCLEAIGRRWYRRVGVCGHAFHPTCIEPWLRARSVTCPTCRRDVRARGLMPRVG